MNKILLSLFFALVDVLITAIVKVAAGTTTPKKLIEAVVEQISRSDMTGEEKLNAVKALLSEAAEDLRNELHALPESLKNLIIETAVAKLKHKFGQLSVSHE